MDFEFFFEDIESFEAERLVGTIMATLEKSLAEK